MGLKDGREIPWLIMSERESPLKATQSGRGADAASRRVRGRGRKTKRWWDREQTHTAGVRVSDCAWPHLLVDPSLALHSRKGEHCRCPRGTPSRAEAQRGRFQRVRHSERQTKARGGVHDQARCVCGARSVAASSIGPLLWSTLTLGRALCRRHPRRHEGATPDARGHGDAVALRVLCLRQSTDQEDEVAT